MDGTSRSLGLPYPPSVNRIWRSLAIKGQTRVLVSREGREYREAVRRSLLPGYKPMHGRLAVQLVAIPPDRRRRDIDNLAKALLDALTHVGIWADDSQVDRLTIVREDPHQDFPQGFVRVDITTIPEAQAELL